jgi:multiple sugar transport system substrate-binding protein
MPVLAGLGIPRGAPNRAGAERLIDYLTQPQQQTRLATQLAFFPVTSAQLPRDVNAGIRLEADAVARQSSAPDALPSLLPVGLGAQGGAFNKVYLDTFQRIVVRGEPVAGVLADEGRILQGLLDQTQAGCWAPDPPSSGACQVA